MRVNAPWCVYNKASTHFLRVFRNGYWQDAIYLTKGGCTRALNAEAAAGRVDGPSYAIMPLEEFRKIEKTEVRIGIVGAAGKEFTVPVNEPWTTGPWSETYWST